jgi:hypothetical protein
MPILQVISNKNKSSRQNQENGVHTAGTRSFAVTQRELELELERPVGRVELYVKTHLNKEGLPVNDYAASKMV